MKLPIIEYAVDIDGTAIVLATTEEQAQRVLRLLQDAVSPSVALAGQLGVRVIKRVIDVPNAGAVDRRCWDADAVAEAFDAQEVARTATALPVAEPITEVVRP